MATRDGALELESSGSAETMAGATRAVLRSMVRTVPRVAPLKFFRPKHVANNPSTNNSMLSKVRMLGTDVFAGALLFAVHSRVALEVNDRLGASESSVGHFVGGSAGGVANATVMRVVTPPDAARAASSAGAATRWVRVASGLPISCTKESLGFGVFFGAYHLARQAIEPPLAAATAAAPPPPGSALHAHALVRSVAAGAAAGGMYHVITFPVTRAIERASPHTDLAAVAAAAARCGLAELYSGCLRAAARGLAVGAVTFGVFDTALHAGRAL